MALSKDESVRYAVFGKEVAPTTGTPHLQGYLSFKSQKRFNAVQKLLPAGAHIEAAKGTPQQNREYCTKGGQFEEFGVIPKVGKPPIKTSEALKLLKDKSLVKILEDDDVSFHQIRGMQLLSAMVTNTAMREVKVVLHIGPAGTGKTYGVWTTDPSQVYSKPTGLWWDGYTGQKVLLLDDYYGYITYHELLKILDVYPYKVPIKGGFVQAQWTEVHITSNRWPHQWYKKGYTPALQRRIKDIILHSIIDGTFSQENYTEAYNEAPTSFSSFETPNATYGDEPTSPG